MTDESGSSSQVIPLGHIFLLWNDIESFIQSVVLQNDKYATSDWYMEWSSKSPTICNQHTIPEIGLDIITNRRGTTLQQAIEYLETTIPHLPSYLTYNIHVEGDLTTISYEIKNFYMFSGPLSKDEAEKLASRKKENVETEKDDDSNFLDDIDLPKKSSKEEKSKDDDRNDDDNEPKDVFETPKGKLRQITITQMYGDNENPPMDNPSGLTETPQVELTDIEQKSKLIDEISVSKLKKLQKLMKSDVWEQLVDTPDYLEKQIESMNKKVQQIEKAVMDKVKKELNKTKQDELDDYEMELTKSMDKAKQSLMQWVQTENEKQNKYMKKVVSDIEKESVHLEQLKKEIAQAEKDYKVQSRLPSYFAPTTTHKDSKPIINRGSAYVPAHAIKKEPSEHEKHYADIFGDTNTTHAATTSPDKVAGVRNYHEKYIQFVDRDTVFTMRDHDFKKGPMLTKPHSNKDLMILYGQIQKQAISYNIFVTPLNHIDKWNHDESAIPPTCYLSEAHNGNRPIYDRMAHALYDKLSKVNFSMTPQAANIMRQDIQQQDGFLTLYNLLCIVHPNLIEDHNKPVKPKLTDDKDIYSFIGDYRQWLAYEELLNRHYTDKESIDYVIENLDNDSRYERAVTAIQGTINTFNQSVRNSGVAVFPRTLKVQNIANTIMSYYSEAEAKTILLPLHQHHDTNNDDNHLDSAMVRALNKRTQNPYQYSKKTPSPQRKTYPSPFGQNLKNFGAPSNQEYPTLRQRLSRFCRCCGQWGHCATVNGCDFAATFINTHNFLSENPEEVDNLLKIYKANQNKRRNSKPGTSNFKGHMAKRFIQTANKRDVRVGDKVRALFDIVGETLEEDMEVIARETQLELSSDDEQYEDTVTGEE